METSPAAKELRLVQLRRDADRRVARVLGSRLQLLDGVDSVYALAIAAFDSDTRLSQWVDAHAVSEDFLDYEEVWQNQSRWRILPSADHPETPARVLISGTGLTHMASVQRRNAMHTALTPAAEQAETDSMRMYRWGVEGGNPAAGLPGTAPEWFYKGNGTMLRGHNDPLTVPDFAEDGGEEPELAGVYLIDSHGQPRRLGMTVGNEFSDHKFEKRNYLYLAHSKLRDCAIGPELVVDPVFESVPGTVSVERAGDVVWSSAITSGEQVMCHSLANLEHHHFKYPQHRIPGDLHIHFFGADAFSFGSGLDLRSGDVMQVEFSGFGRPLRNPLHIEAGPEKLIAVLPA